MMASTLAANSSTMPPASGSEREHKIAPMASRRRYVCEPLHIDELLNAILFLLIGLEVIAIVPDPLLLLVGALSIPLVLAARGLAVSLPIVALRPFFEMGRLAVPTLIWGGLRGGISIALALSLPEGAARTAILTVTYAVVLFSVIVQGGSVGKLIGRLSRARPQPTD